MHRLSPVVPRSLLLAAALAGTACPLPPEYVGGTITTTGTVQNDGSTTGQHDETLGDDTGVVSSTTFGTTFVSGSGATTEGSGTSTGPAPGAYASHCELVGVGPDIQATEITPQPSCDGGICLLVKDFPLACAGDPECAEEDAGSVCGQNGLCNLSPTFLEANTRCTQTCEMDEDCPDIPGCTTGVRCAVFTLLGELCCQKVCACTDFLYLPEVESNEMNCDNDPQLCS